MSVMIRNLVPVISDVLPSVLRPTRHGASCLNANQVRTTVIVRRKTAVKLAKIGKIPTIRRRDNIYEFEENVHSKPLSDIDCILTDYFEGIGDRGDVVTVPRRLFRNVLYPSKNAIYASPENMAENEIFTKQRDESAQPKLTPFARMTLKKLTSLFLPIPMSGETTWTLNKQHIKLALRKVGVESEEHCIELPEKPITQKQELNFKLTINGMESQTVKGHIYLVYQDPSQNDSEELPEIWTSKTNK